MKLSTSRYKYSNLVMDKCNFCEGMPRKFTCPRCNADYCSLKCYQSLQHQSCSEQFYKECVTQELGNQVNNKV